MRWRLERRGDAVRACEGRRDGSAEAFDAADGANFQASDDSPHAVDCELVDGAFVAYRPTNVDRRPPQERATIFTRG